MMIVARDRALPRVLRAANPALTAYFSSRRKLQMLGTDVPEQTRAGA